MKILGAGLILAATLPGAFAQTNAPATRVLSLSDCIDEALRHNLDIQIERFDPQISQFNVSLAYSSYDPVLSLGGDHSHDRNGTNSAPDVNSLSSGLSGSLPLGTTYNLGANVADTYRPQPEFANGSVGMSVSQPLLKGAWIDSTRETILIDKNALKHSEQQLRLQIITSITAVENAYDELVYARQNVTVEQQALDLAQTQLDQDRQRVEFGSLAPLDVTQDESQVAQSRANLIAAQYTLVSDENALKNLITDDYSKWHELELVPAGPLTAVWQYFDLQDSWTKGLSQRPELLQAKLDVEKQGIVLKYDRSQFYPSLDLTGSFGYNGVGQNISGVDEQFGRANLPYYSYGAQLSMPLSLSSARNTYKADKATAQQVLLRLKQLEQNVMVAIDDAVKQANSAWESVDATKQSRIYAEAALDAEQKKYSVGKSTTFTVLQLQNNLTSARSQEIRALANYAEALANLSQQEGDTIERHHLNLEIK